MSTALGGTTHISPSDLECPLPLVLGRYLGCSELLNISHTPYTRDYALLLVGMAVPAKFITLARQDRLWPPGTMDTGVR